VARLFKKAHLLRCLRRHSCGVHLEYALVGLLRLPRI